MTRTIKFRGKNSKDEWVYGSIIINETENEKGKFQVAFIVRGLPCASDGGDFYTARMERVKIETIGQYTGLDDENDKEIYEGDIVKCGEFVYKVIYKNRRIASFALSRKQDMFVHYFGEAMEADECEVIGNIYDNPNLLKK